MRWCEVERNGRPVYHGPVWRWHPNGQLEGKEYYLEGDAAGVWPSYYENGKMSSLGALEKGHKHGSWKYWDEAGQLKVEVTYSDAGNSKTEFYASGQKKASGTFKQSGKVGKWVYWADDGTERARCDFGTGLFALPDRACRTIAENLDPKGFSPPIPVGRKIDAGRITLTIASQVFELAAPQGWVSDVKAGRREDLPIVFYPAGKAWRDAGANMYFRVFFREGRSFEQTMDDDRQGFQENVTEYKETSTKRGRLAHGFSYLAKLIVYKPLIGTDSPFSIVASNQIQERIAYLDASDKFVITLVVATDSDLQLQQSIPAFEGILQSIRSNQ